MTGASRLVQSAAMAVLLCVAILASSCAESAPTIPPQNREITVFAASSLKDVFEQVRTWWQEGGGKITYNFAGSQALATQLSQGAKADVFASADARNMDAAVAAGVIVTTTQKLLLTNKLQVITSNGSPVTTLIDLAKPGVKLVLAAETVPAGNYSLQALDNLSKDPIYGANFKDAVLANVVSKEDNVRQVVTKVELGEADAGIVYVTDAKTGKVGTLEIPDKYNVIAHYYIAPVKSGPNPEGGQRYIDYLLSEAGQQALADFGFGKAEEASR